MENFTDIKQQLYEHCAAYVAKRLANAEQAMANAQRAANAESKSSAGDKYETTRAMMQLEKEMHATQWNEALKLKKELEQLSLDRPTERIGPGSLVLTDSGRYFLAISLGFVKLGGTNYVVLSPASPLGMRLCGLAVGEEATFNKQRFHIQAVY
jgi:transcription elongation GreA/GreB family factor